MPCYRPLTAYRDTDGRVTFDQRGSSSINELQLPCGRCIGCRITRSQHWALRCVHEAQLHDRNSFITLTYSDEHLPPDGGLRVDDWQTFAKRVRHHLGPFRFFHCGEYGEENLRPHYHALIFGLDFAQDREPYKRNQRGELLYTSEALTWLWGLGHAIIGDLTFESAAYCARYTLKKITGAQAAEHYERFDAETGEVWTVRPEYATMSRKPGIGHHWLEQYGEEVYPDDEVVHQARRFRPPRYYDDQLEEQFLESIKTRRRERVQHRRDQGELTPERLAVKEAALNHWHKSTERGV